MNTNTNDTNTNDLLLAAITGYEAQIRQMSEKIAELRGRIGGIVSVKVKARAHHVSAAGRKRIAEAQRKRWQAQKNAKASAKKTRIGKPVAKKSARKIARTTGRKAAK